MNLDFLATPETLDTLTRVAVGATVLWPKRTAKFRAINQSWVGGADSEPIRLADYGMSPYLKAEHAVRRWRDQYVLSSAEVDRIRSVYTLCGPSEVAEEVRAELEDVLADRKLAERPVMTLAERKELLAAAARLPRSTRVLD